LAEIKGFVDEFALREACVGAIAGGKAADDDFDVVFSEPVEAEPFVRRVEFSVGSNEGVVMARSPFCDIGVVAFAVSDHGCEEREGAAVPDGVEEALSELIAGLGFHGNLAIGTKRSAEPAEQESEEVVDLGDGGDGTFASAAGIALFDADGWGDAGDEIDVRVRHLFHELAGIGVDGVEESALSFGEEEIESQCAFSGAADSSDHDELIARDSE
jgi:hypothetical protein